MEFNKYRIDEITINLDNLRKPLNNEQRKQISNKKLYPYYGANNIMDYVDEYIFDEEIICIAEDGGSWGFGEKCSYIVNEKCWVNNHAHVLKAKDHNLNLKYLNYYLNYHDLNSKITGTTRGKLTKSALSSIEIMLPNREKQDAIVNTLDKAQELIDKRKEQIDQLDELVKSRFIEMFGDPIINSKGLKVKNFEEVVRLQRGFDLPTYARNENGIYNVWGSNGILSKHSTYKVDEPGIVTGRSGSLGKVYYTTEPYWPLNTTLFSKNTYGNNVVYLAYLLRFYKLERFSNGTGVPTLNRNLLDGKKIIDTPLEKQNEFAEFVKHVDKLKFEMEKSLKELEDNFNSLMQKAFKGELF